MEALAAAAQPRGVEAALLRRHKALHLEALYSLSLFVTCFNTKQAVFMLDMLPDAESTLQVIQGEGFGPWD